MRRSALLVASLFVVACSGGGGSTPHTPNPTPTPTVAPTPTPAPTSSGSEAAYQCPTSDTVSGSERSISGQAGAEATRRLPTGPSKMASVPAPNLLAVTYDASTLNTNRTSISTFEQRSGLSLVREFDFSNTHIGMRIVRITSGTLAAAEAELQHAPGVRSVARTGFRRRALSVTTPYFPNDPYFQGFSAPAPLYEESGSPGQWDKHVERLEDAFGYSQSGNGSGIVNANALGSSSIKIAIIDTGEDTTHPELSQKIVYQKCFITDPTGAQSSSNFVTDQVGHGTDVSGIAAAATSNGLGFTGSGGSAVIYAYRVFPSPDDSCATDNGDAQCVANSADIASSIHDAVAHKVNVISLSLGDDPTNGGGCPNAGQDQDQIEGAAIADAVAAGTVVVASSGNNAASSLSSPACVTGVLAAGATGLADGSPNGTGSSTGSASNPNEYVASYSNAGSPGKAVNSPSAWGIVAPGGDPAESEETGTVDELHWIENIWTTTPYQSSPSDTSFEGECEPDFNSVTNTVDCRTLIAGTSMSAPNVAGSVALILAVNPSYQSASAMKTLLCETADDINDPNEGCGRLDVYRAMAKALNDTSPPAARPIP